MDIPPKMIIESVAAVIERQTVSEKCACSEGPAETRADDREPERRPEVSGPCAGSGGEEP